MLGLMQLKTLQDHGFDMTEIGRVEKLLAELEEKPLQQDQRARYAEKLRDSAIDGDMFATKLAELITVTKTATGDSVFERVALAYGRSLKG